MTPQPTPPHSGDTARGDRRSLAKGAGLAVLGRLGALVEAASFPLFLWLYGPVAFGAYATIWAVTRIATGVTVMGMDVAIQRFAPALAGEDAVHRALSVALATAGTASLVGAGAMAVFAPELAQLAEWGGTAPAAGPLAVRLFALALPLWTAMELLTAAVRARRKFGPEIRIRAFYEPAARIVFAVALAGAGVTTHGLFAAHLLSMALACALSVDLARRFYTLRRCLRPGRDPGQARRLLAYAAPMMPANLIIRLFSELPIIALNALTAGAAGTASAGYYAIARKIASLLQLVYNAFDYVLTPLAAHREGQADRAAVADMYAFSARLMIALGLVLAGFLIAGRHLFVGVLGPESAPAGAALAVLAAGRLVTFFFGQAAATVRTLGSTLWSLMNGGLGLVVMLALLPVLIRAFGAPGAAGAAAAGLIVARGLPCLEVGLFYRLWPYSAALRRPALVGAAGAGGLLLMGELSADWPIAGQIAVIGMALVLAMLSLLRYGLSSADAAAFGKLGRRLRREREPS